MGGYRKAVPAIKVLESEKRRQMSDLVRHIMRSNDMVGEQGEYALKIREYADEWQRIAVAILLEKARGSF